MSTVFCTGGRGFLVDLLMYNNTGYAGVARFSAFGTGAGTPGISDTTLFGEVGNRVSGVGTRYNYSTFQLQAAHGIQDNYTGTNAGIFSRSGTSPILITKGDFTPIPFLSGDNVTFTYRLEFQ